MSLFGVRRGTRGTRGLNAGPPFFWHRKCPRTSPHSLRRRCTPALQLVLWTGIFCASSWALCFPLALPRRVLESPLIWRLPFHGGVFCTIGAFIAKWYMEVYQAGIMGQQINYESNPRATHLLLGLIGSAWLMLVVGLWPQYHVFSLLVVALFGIGVLFPVTMWSVMYGRSVENVIFMVATTYFVVRSPIPRCPHSHPQPHPTFWRPRPRNSLGNPPLVLVHRRLRRPGHVGSGALDGDRSRALRHAASDIPYTQPGSLLACYCGTRRDIANKARSTPTLYATPRTGICANPLRRYRICTAVATCGRPSPPRNILGGCAGITTRWAQVPPDAAPSSR